MPKVSRPFTPRVIQNTGYRAEVIKELETLEPPFILEIKPFKAYANNKQKALYHVWLAELSRETGNSTETIDKYLKREFLPLKVEQIGDRSITLLTSISELEEKPMSDYLSHVKVWALQELGVDLRSNRES